MKNLFENYLVRLLALPFGEKQLLPLWGGEDKIFDFVTFPSLPVGAGPAKQP